MSTEFCIYLFCKKNIDNIKKIYYHRIYLEKEVMTMLKAFGKKSANGCGCLSAGVVVCVSYGKANL